MEKDAVFLQKKGFLVVLVLITFIAVRRLVFGVCGLYIAKIYTEVKRRPMYIVI